jgi:hypothetical protein
MEPYDAKTSHFLSCSGDDLCGRFALTGGYAVDGGGVPPHASGGCSDSNASAWVSAVVAAGGTVSTAQQTRVCNLIVGLKAASLFSNLDRLWLFAPAGQHRHHQSGDTRHDLRLTDIHCEPRLHRNGLCFRQHRLHPFVWLGLYVKRYVGRYLRIYGRTNRTSNNRATKSLEPQSA